MLIDGFLKMVASRNNSLCRRHTMTHLAATTCCILWLASLFVSVDGSVGPIIRKPWALPSSAMSNRNSSGGGNTILNPLALHTIQTTPRAGGSGSGGGAYSFFPDDANEFLQRYDKNNLDILVSVMSGITQSVILCGKTIIPPTVTFASTVVKFYLNLPTDMILAQIGLDYCFAGGYYPTLFSSIQAARHCGWDTMITSIQDLTAEAIKVIDVTTDEASNIRWDEMNKRQILMKQTDLILKTMDPMKINTAIGSLYTTWLGVSVVLEKEYARVISLSMTLAYYCERVTSIVLEPPLRFVVSNDYHKWIPVMLGWACKAAAMNVAWRIQRILTASTSAMTGGVMFSRSLLRMFRRHRRQQQRRNKNKRSRWSQDEEDDEDIDNIGRNTAMLEDIIGFIVAGVGFWTQFQAQYKNNFSFEVPFPINLITWPFDLAEKWIQWQITK